MEDLDFTVLLLDEQMKAEGLNVSGVYMGEADDKSTWGASWKVEPTDDEKARAQTVIDSYDDVKMMAEGKKRQERSIAGHNIHGAILDIISILLRQGTIDKELLKPSTLKMLRDVDTDS